MRNILYITIDCLRADHVGFMGYPKATTPHLDRLAKESTIFEKAIVAAFPTYHSFPALMAGRYPFGLGRDLVGLGPGETTLASFLKANGYRTAASVTGNPYLSRWMGYEQGFDEFVDFMESEPDPKETPEEGFSFRGPLKREIERFTKRSAFIDSIYREVRFYYGLWTVSRKHGGDYSRLLAKYPPAGAVTERALAWLGGVLRSESPFFLWLHYMDAHRPYLPSRQALKAVGREDLSPKDMYVLRNVWLRNDITRKRLLKYREDFVDLYDASIASIDENVGRLLQVLQESEVWDDTLLVVTSDHGEEFLEHGETDHDPLLVNQELIHVPLLIRVPGDRPSKRVRFPFGLIDLAPTLLEAAGMNPPPSFTGRGRWGAVVGDGSVHDPVVTEVGYCRSRHPKGRSLPHSHRLMAVQDGRYKLIINFATEHHGLFDLEEDPDEKKEKPLSENPAASTRLLQSLQNHLERECARRYTRPELLLRIQRLKGFLSTPRNHGDSAQNLME